MGLKKKPKKLTKEFKCGPLSKMKFLRHFYEKLKCELKL